MNARVFGIAVPTDSKFIGLSNHSVAILPMILVYVGESLTLVKNVNIRIISLF